MKNFNNFRYHKNNVPTPYHKKRLFFDDLRNKFYKELLESETVTEFLKPYNPDSRESFLMNYAERKAYLAEHYESYTEIPKQAKELKFKDKTEGIFQIIRQKKLFNLQLQWRAEQIKIKEIKMAYDFEFWGKHIESCTFITPVTDAEISVMKQFLKDNYAWDDFDFWDCYEYQDYRQLMEKNDQGNFENMSNWYQFYDTMMGTGSLLLLPDVRGTKEDYYINKSHEDERRKMEEKAKQDPQPAYVPPLPHLYSFAHEMYQFAKSCEKDDYFIDLFEVWKQACEPSKTEDGITDEQIEQAIWMLQEAEFPVIMPSGIEWREAIILCAHQYQNTVISENLDAVYEEYQMFLELGISKGLSREEIQEKYNNDRLLQYVAGTILHGRELCGEPKNFDF